MYCNNCAHRGEKAGECTFGGTCVIRSLNLHRDPYATSAVKVAATPAPQAKEEPVFNPFQRGNGCLLAGYTHEEIFTHTR